MDEEQGRKCKAAWSGHAFGVIGLLWIAALTYILWSITKGLWDEHRRKRHCL